MIINGKKILDGVFEPGTYASPSIISTLDATTGLYFPGVATVGLAISGKPAFLVETNPTYGHRFRFLDNNSPANEFQILIYQESGPTPRAAWYGGQDATDISFIMRMAHKDSAVGNEITAGFSIDTIAENTPTASHRLRFFSTSANATISTATGSGNGLPLYLGTTTTAATSLIKINQAVDGQGLELHPTAVTSGMPTDLLFVGAAHTGLTASTEVTAINFNLVPTKTWATGNITTQREFLIQAPNYGFVGASSISQASTFAVAGAPIAGTNCTITSAMSILAESYNGNASTNYGIRAFTPGILDGVGNTSGAFGFAISTANVHLGNQTATTNIVANLVLGQMTLNSTTNIRSILLPANLYINGIPKNGGNVSFAEGPYGIYLSGATTITQLASSNPTAICIPDYTVTLEGVTQITSGFPNGISLGTITIAQSGGAVVVDRAAALYIKSAPTAGALVTLTDAYAIFVDDGNSRFDGKVFVGTDANTTDFSGAKIIVSQGDSTFTSTALSGIIGEAVATNGGLVAQGVGGYGITVGDKIGYGVTGNSKVNNTADTASSVGVYGSARSTHAGGKNIALYGWAENGASNYSFWGEAGILHNSTDINIYEAVNDGNPEIRLGATDAEEFHIQTVYDAGAQTLDYVKFTTDVASATADKGKYIFNVDGTDILSIVDAGISFATKATDILIFTNNGSSLAIKDGATTYLLFDTRTGIENIFVNMPFKMNSRYLGKQGSAVASASTIALGTDGNVFELTGTTAVNLITATGWQDGSEIILIANENVIINHGAATSGSDVTILLAGGVNFSMSANDTLTLVLSTTTAGGQAWREKCSTMI